MAAVDWEFLDRIYDKRNLSPKPVSEDNRKDFMFEAFKYQDAVVMPWYRNQDQPQVDTHHLHCGLLFKRGLEVIDFVIFNGICTFFHSTFMWLRSVISLVPSPHFQVQKTIIHLKTIITRSMG